MHAGIQPGNWRCLISAALCFCLSVATPSLAQDAVPPTPKFLGPTRCADCHNTPNPLRFRDFVLQTESARFIAEDKHVQAVEVLKGELGQAMAKRLGIDDVLNARQCLSCHANWQKDQPQKVPNSEFGVTCESCHGPSSLWDTPHSLPEWRLLPPVDKARLGLVDIRDPVKRAEQCFSCHIGNAGQGKLITHEMYAAGHPPLPGIEIESFIDQMPAHWRYLPEKGPFESREEYLQVNFPRHTHDPSLDLPRTRSTIISGLVALRESLELFATQAHPDNPQWPELAAFDCQACHHDLRAPSWRQQRDAQFAPGRPTLPEWPFALAKVSFKQIAGDDAQKFAELCQEFEDQRQKLNASVQKQPFGDKHAHRQAAAFASWLEPHITSLITSRYDRAAASRAAQELSNLGPRDFPDFHSARQLAWALGIMERELSIAYPMWPAEEPPANGAERRMREARSIRTFEEWRTEQWTPQRKDWADRWQIASPRFELPLILPAGQAAVIENNLPRSLEAISNYDAAVFRKLLRDVAARRKNPDQSPDPGKR